MLAHQIECQHDRFVRVLVVDWVGFDGGYLKTVENLFQSLYPLMGVRRRIVGLRFFLDRAHGRREVPLALGVKTK